jgi:adenylate cyclase
MAIDRPKPRQRPIQFRSIQSRLMTATALWMTLVMGCGIWLWVRDDSAFHQQEARRQLKGYGEIISQSLQNDLSAQRWASIEGNLGQLTNQNRELLYLVVSDRQQRPRAMAPAMTAGPLVPIGPGVRVDGGLPRIRETHLLQPVVAPNGQIRGQRGDRLMELELPIRSAVLGQPAQGTLRIGFSLNALDRSIQRLIRHAVAYGLLVLGLGLVGTYQLSQRFSRPLLRLRTSAAQIAAGDFSHRAEWTGLDEVGGLARSFNDMAAKLQSAFGQQQQTLESFARFVPGKFLEAIAPNGIENIEVGQSVRRRMTILFCDIRGYTAMAETMSPTETFEFLNGYLATMGTAIEAHGGIIDKYIGDAIMALFDESHSDNALRAALAMHRALTEFNGVRADRGLEPVAVGMGLHRGDVILGTIGFASRIESTVIGDAVNVAARIERFTRQCACPVLLSDAIVTALERPELFDIQLVNANARIRGKRESLGLYQLHSPLICHAPVEPAQPLAEAIEPGCYPPANAELSIELGCCPTANAELSIESGCCPPAKSELPIKSSCCLPPTSKLPIEVHSRTR